MRARRSTCCRRRRLEDAVWNALLDALGAEHEADERAADPERGRRIGPAFRTALEYMNRPRSLLRRPGPRGQLDLLGDR